MEDTTDVLNPYVFPATIPREFDPTHIPDFKRFGRVIMARETILLPLSRPWTVIYSLKPQKIDTNTHVNGGSQPWWITMVSSYGESDSAVNAVQSIRSYSLSFAGDVVTEVPVVLPP